MQKEHYAVLRLLQYNYDESLLELFEDKDINWISVLGYLSYHRVAGLVYDKMNRYNIRLLDYPVFFSMFMTYESQKTRFNLQNHYLTLLSEHLTSRNIRHAFLKGAFLGNTIYTSGTRASNDIDILIDKKSISETSELLYSLGFVQGKYNYKKNIIVPYSNEEISFSVEHRGEIAPFIKVTDNPTIKTVDVDVNFSVDWTPDIGTNAVNSFLEERMMISTESGTPIYVLNYEFNLLELCVHFYKDSALIDIVQKRKVLDLYKIVDIYYFLHEYLTKIDVNKFVSEANRHNLCKHAYYALTCVGALFPEIQCPMLDYILNQLRQDDDCLSIIFDQYNPDVKFTTQLGLPERFFKYRLFDSYSTEESVL